MSGEVEHYPGDARVIIQNVKGKRVAYLTALGYMTSVQMKADAIEVCRCPLRVALDSTMGKCSTIEELRDHCAAANAVRHVLRDRKRYGGPHNLPRAMTVSEAGAR